MKTKYKNRFESIIKFLRTYDFVKTKFNMRVLNDGPYDENGQGTSACIVGLYPLIFPNDYKYKNRDGEFLPTRFSPMEDDETGVAGFLGLTFDELSLLIFIKNEKVTSFGGKVLTENHTPQDAAFNLEKFVEYNEKQ